MKNFEKLFSPAYIGKLKLRNRIIMPPMATNLANEDGSVSNRLIDYYAERAKGGTGLIIIENVQVKYPEGKNVACQLRLDDDKYVGGFFELAEDVHKYGSKIFMQIHHAGRQTSLGVTEGVQPTSCSPIPCGFMGVQPRELTLNEIEDLIERFANTAARAKQATFDGVEIHGAHGYLVGQFMSPYTNKRTDGFGGNFDRRMKFPLEIIKKIKEKVGDDFPISFRLSVDEFIDGGITLEEGIKISKTLEKAGVHVLHVSSGIYESMPTILDTMSKEEGWRTYLAEEVKKHVSIPVITVGNIRNPEFMEKLLEEDKTDFIAVGRGLIADPELPLKAKEGKSENIKKCISCNIGCIGGHVFSNQRLRCTINPMAGRENRYKYLNTKNNEKKNVLVIGGGVAGMEAAINAKMIGHNVTLVEKSDKLGGQLNLAAIPPGKAKIEWFREYLENEINRLNVDIKLNTEGSLSNIESMKPDVVIVAAGSSQLEPRFDVSGKPNMAQSWDVLKGNVPIEKGEKVVIIGGVLVGSETAHYILKKGGKVTVIDTLPEVAMDMEPISRFELLGEFGKSHIETLTNTVVTKIDNNKIYAIDKSGRNLSHEGDKIIISIGQKSNSEDLVNELEQRGITTKVIGDSKDIGQILDAVFDGFNAALTL